MVIKMIDIKEKIRELCKNYVDASLVEAFLNKYSSTYLYDDIIKDMFTEGDNYSFNDTYSLSIWKFDEELIYTLLDYTNTTDDDGQPEELNKFVLKNSNLNPTDIFFG